MVYNKIETRYIQIIFITNPNMEYIEVARQTIRRYEERLEETKQILLLYKGVNDSCYESQLQQEEIRHTQILKSAQESLAMIEQSLQIP